MKKIISKFLAILMIATIVFSGFCSSVKAGASEVTCSVRVEGLSGTIAEGNVTGNGASDLVKKLLDSKNINWEDPSGSYITSINNIAATGENGWNYYLKSTNPAIGISAPYPCYPTAGDELIFYYGPYNMPYVNDITFNTTKVSTNQHFTITASYKSLDWITNAIVTTPIKNATFSIDSIDYTTNDKGTILLPGLSIGDHSYKISGYSSIANTLPSVVMDKGTITINKFTSPSTNYFNASFTNDVRDNSSITKNIDNEVSVTGAKLSKLSDPWVGVDMQKLGLNVDKSYVVDIAKDVSAGMSSIGNTTLEKYIMGLIAAGYSPYNFIGQDLVAELYNRDINTFQINDAVFALGAYYYGNIPENYKINKTNLVNLILSKKLSYNQSGKSYSGWTYGGSAIDSDMTGITLCALAPFYNTNANVKSAVDSAALSLSYLEDESGNITSSYGIASETLSFAILGLTAVGINPEGVDFTKSKGDLVAALLSFKGTEGEYKHTLSGGNDLLASEEALRALTAIQNYKKSGSYNYFASNIDAKNLALYSTVNLKNDLSLALVNSSIANKESEIVLDNSSQNSSDITSSITISALIKAFQNSLNSLSLTSFDNSISLLLPADIADFGDYAALGNSGATLQFTKNSLTTAEISSITKNSPTDQSLVVNPFVLNLNILGSNGEVLKGIHNFKPGKAVKISLNIKDASNVNTSRLAAYYYDETTSKWVKIEGGGFDKSSSTFTFETSHFSTFAVFQDNSVLPKTGSLIDFNILLSLGVLLLISGIGFIITSKKKFNK